ncbi:MAG: hypothetical protein Kow0075_13060 [Salibacteraceae bacterium]
MAGEATQAIDPKELWGGGRSPFSVSYGKLMMWFFLISDALTFGAFLTALGYQRHHLADQWPITEEIFFHFPFTHAELPLLYVAFMTFILIISSVTMVLAVEAGHRMDKKGVVKWLAWTVVGGLIFLGSQAWEWYTFIAGPDGDITTWADNATLQRNAYGPQLYADFFFFITGFHGSHVASGVVLNIIVLIQAMNGVFEKRGHYEMVEKVGLYWHFVDLVWVFVFTFFYLI